jgi:hypothetical protein
MRSHLHPATRATHIPCALGLASFWGWYFADGAKEAAPA